MVARAPPPPTFGAKLKILKSALLHPEFPVDKMPQAPVPLCDAFSGVARVAEVGGKQGAKVNIRGASLHASPKGRCYIDERSRGRSRPLHLRHFRQPGAF